MQMHKTEDDAGNAFQSQVRAVVGCARPWLGLMFHISEDGTLHLERTTHEFPMGRIGDVLELIKRDVTAELGLGPLDHSPLPLAPGFGIVGVEDGDVMPQPVSIAEAVGESP